MLRLVGASYRYPSRSAPALGPLNLEIAPGELVLITGPTGCGKSTLLRLAAGLLQRHGHGAVGGEVAVDGADPGRMRPAERVRKIGFVSQDPSDQIATGTLGDEIAFGMESAGVPAAELAPRVAALLRALGLPEDPDAPALALSGGQRQRLMVAAALAAGARLLLLDEPLSQLDPAGAAGLLERLRALAEREGVAIGLVEHRLEAALPACHRVVVLAEGRIAGAFSAGQPDVDLLRRLGLSVPGLLDLDNRLAAQGRSRDQVRRDRRIEAARKTPGSTLIEASHLNFSYGAALALADVTLSLAAGERVAVLGANGSGKSTLLLALAGHAHAGAVVRRGRVVDVPQDPDLALFCETAADELAYGPVEARRSLPDVAALVAAAAEGLSVAALLDRAPQALSRGQRLRVAVAAALTCRPAALLLDEPTSGQDRDQVERMMAALSAALGPGAALVFATHDLDLAARYSDRWVVLEDGRIAVDAPPAEALARLPAALVLPPLLAWCRDEGLPPATPAQIAGWAR